MATEPSERIIKSRRLLGNPYAYLDGEDGFSAAEGDDTGETELLKQRISNSRRILMNQYAHLDDKGGLSVAASELRPERGTPLKPSAALIAEYAPLIERNSTRRRRSTTDLESIARVLQHKMWRDRKRIWPGAAPHNPVDVLDPAVALRLLGFEYELCETLGSFHCAGEDFEVAGVIDDTVGEVRISRRIERDVRNFTTAHELGHAVLHEARGLHRDRPLNGASPSRDPVEFEADKFASFFLMPAKLLQNRFKAAFGRDRFELNETTKFALLRSQARNLDQDKLTLRDLSRILASAGTFNGIHFLHLAEQFRVSIEAMAIRIEELGLIEW